MAWLASVFLSWLISSVAFYLCSLFIPGFVLSSSRSAFWVAALFAVVNALTGWLVWSLLTLGTFGLALLFGFITKFLVTAIVIKITDWLTDSLTITGFAPAIFAAFVISLTTMVAEGILNVAGVSL